MIMTMKITMNIVKRFRDDFGNLALIEKVNTFAYNGAPKKTEGYRLMLFAEYDDNFLYHVSVYETLEEAENKLKCFSCDTWKEIEQ